MATSPAYETTASIDASSVNTNQTTHPWPTPTALLPSYSPSSPSCWMKEEAIRTLQTSHDFYIIRTICKFVPGLDPAVSATVLSKRWKLWLDAFLKVLCQREVIQEPPCDSPLSTAEAIVRIIRRRQLSPAPEWDGAWIFSALNSSTDISTIAEKFDAQMHSVFSRITFEDWVEWTYGFPNDPIQSLLNTGFNLRNNLARSVQNHTIMVDRLQLLQKVLPSRHPLPLWIVSTAIASDTISEPSEALRFFIDPIKQRDKEQSSGILSVVQRFSILNTRHELQIIGATDIKWPKPFSTDFYFWESIQINSPLDLAKSNTESVSKLYRKLAAEDVLDNSEYMKGIERRWSDLSIDILACLIINENLTVYFMDFAKAR
ncbi:hypothetical protein LARI1_G007778 [Lachnellula arida]|uniref:Uncharacterized protein n=1 Tax=Lachnellula arida TaxID=1316785 RepID=A0A8T9B6Z6_9HELO|nr:hypothetical protein LARI1_G007778 [Lachnellula arida]